jgi:hypothetical protein
MAIVKSLLTGAVAVLVYFLIVGAIMAKLLTNHASTTGLGAVGVSALPLLIGALAVFAVSGFWMYRRSSGV